MAEIIELKEDLCESCEHTLICVNEDPNWPTYECRYYLKRRAHGHWVPMNGYPDERVCSECAWQLDGSFKTPYCPYCGAIMDEEVTNENR